MSSLKNQQQKCLRLINNPNIKPSHSVLPIDREQLFTGSSSFNNPYENKTKVAPLNSYDSNNLLNPLQDNRTTRPNHYMNVQRNILTNYQSTKNKKVSEWKKTEPNNKIDSKYPSTNKYNPLSYLNELEKIISQYPELKLASSKHKEIGSCSQEPLIPELRLNRKKYSNSEQQEQKEHLKQTMSTQTSYIARKGMNIGNFQIGKQLGKGKFGKVVFCRHKKTGMVFSLKIIKKSTIIDHNIVEQFIREIKIQTFTYHSHIVKLYSVFDDSQNVYLLLEFCYEGNLYQYLQAKHKLPENEAAEVLYSLCSAVGELHYNQIIHRDIKPQNIVLCFGMAKICDFGWSTTINKSMRETVCGTPLYICPQILKGQPYNQKVDQWAIGILSYEMMTGTLPFKITTKRDLLKILNETIRYPENLSSAAVDFMKKLLERDPKNRKSLEEICEHSFLNSD